MAVKRNAAMIVNGADEIAGRVFNGRQVRRKSARTGRISTGRNVEFERLVRPQAIVTIAPGIERALNVEQIGEEAITEDFELKSAMEALFFALSLRVIRTTMSDADTELKEPDIENCIGRIEVIAPGSAVVHKDFVRKSIALESQRKELLYGGTLLVGAGL